jgi:hypothetical protein
MQPCNRIYYSTVHWRLNMFRAADRSSSEALTVFAASGLHTYVVIGRSQVWVSSHSDLTTAGHQLELLMMSGVQLETCWAFNERWNNKFYYKVASCWLFLLSKSWYIRKYFVIPECIIQLRQKKRYWRENHINKLNLDI